MSPIPENPILSYMRSYATSDAAFETFDLPAEDIVDGDPKTEVAIHYRSEDGSVLVGVSRFSEGTYRYRQTADEINYVTKGRMIITSDRDDQTIVCTEASVTRLDKGVTYTKSIVEPYEEIFVMLGDGSVEM